MAIARMLPTNLFFIPEFSRLYESSKLASIGLLLRADDEGRGYDDPHTLARAIDSYDSQVEISLKQLHEKGLILIYEVKGKRYYQITNWGQMQVIRYAHTSAFPPPEVPEPATLTRTETTTQNHQLPTSEPSPASTLTNTTTITNINKEITITTSSSSGEDKEAETPNEGTLMNLLGCSQQADAELIAEFPTIKLSESAGQPQTGIRATREI